MKKVLAIILAMMFAVSLVVPALADGEALLYLDADPTEIDAGDTVEVTLSIDDNPGVAGTTLWIIYNKDAFYVADPEEDVFATGRTGSRLGLQASKIESNTLHNFTDAYDAYGNVGFVFGQDTNTARNGGLCTVIFTAKDDAVTGDYSFDVVVKDLGNAAGLNVPFVTDGVSVKVNGSAAPQQDEVTVDMSLTTADADSVSANLTVNIPAGDNYSDYTVTIDNGTPVTLADDGKISFPKDAKRMGETVTVVVKKGDDVAFQTATSVKAYCEAIISGDGFTTEQKAVASAMLAYGAAAQKFFNYETDNLVSDAVVSTPVSAAAGRFDYTALRAALKAANAPVNYTSMNAAFNAETTLMLAFQVKDASAANEALAWFNANVAVAGANDVAIMASGANRFIVVKIVGITVDAVSTAHDISVAGDKVSSISLAHYLAAVEASNTASAAMKDLARALYAYAGAVDALA